MNQSEKLFENSDLPQSGSKMVAKRKTSGRQAVSSGVLKAPLQDADSICLLPEATICLRLQRKEFGVFKQLLKHPDVV